MRDVLAGDVPTVLPAAPDALAVLATAGIVPLRQVPGARLLYPILLGAAACAILRRMAIYRDWGVPVAYWHADGSE